MPFGNYGSRAIVFIYSLVGRTPPNGSAHYL